MQFKDYPLTGVNSAEKRRVELLLDAGFSQPESMEIKTGQFSITGFPEPKKKHHLVIDSEKFNLEHNYYWLVGHAMNDFDMPYSLKITDSTAATVSSSTFGDMQARMSAQQGSVSNYLASIGKMIKDLFGLVRELRQIRERLGYYKEANGPEKKVADSAEKTLKGIWIDLVEGGTQNPSSVLGLSQKVGFTILPDLFFSAPPMKDKDVESYVKSLDFNDQIKNMLQRKLYQYYRWKEETHQELETKKNFQIRYLHQHFDAIRMYLNWVKPYLRHIEMLNLDQDKMENDAMLVNSFQSQVAEIETLAYANPIDGVYPVVSFHLYYRSQPSMDFHAKDAYHQKGPIHQGRTEATIRVYAWTEDEMKQYVGMRRKEDFTLLESIDNSLKDAIRSLGAEILGYLKELKIELPDDWLPPEARKKETTEKKEPPRQTIYEPFVEAGKGMVDIFSPLVPKSFSLTNPFSGQKRRAREEEEKLDEARKKAFAHANTAAWMAFKNYKKSKGFFSW